MIHNQILFVVLAFLAVVSAQNLQTCVTSFDNTKDYFPVKSTVLFAQSFTLTYNLSYKVLTNTAGTARPTYVLYQCGTPQPNATLFPTGAKFFSVPAKKVWAYGDSDVSYLEFLGLRTTIAGADVAGNTSPCIMKRAELGQVIDIADKLTNSSDFAGNDVAFGSSANFAPNVATNYYSDPGLKNRAEWLKFYAVFYNKEDVANNLTATIFNNTDCLRNFAAKNVKSAPVIAFVSNGGQYGYSVSGGTGYKKDAITFAGGVPLGDKTFPAANTTDLMNFIKNVDVLIDESYFTSTPSLDQILANYGVNQTNVSTVYKWANKIFREDRLRDAAYNLDWLDAADVLADEVVADLMNAINSSLPVPTYQRTWLRNIYTEATVVLTSAQCTDPSSTTLDDFSFNCLAYTAPSTTTTTTTGPTTTTTTGPTTTTTGKTNNSNVVAVTISMLMVALFMML